MVRSRMDVSVTRTLMCDGAVIENLVRFFEVVLMNDSLCPVKQTEEFDLVALK